MANRKTAKKKARLEAKKKERENGNFGVNKSTKNCY